MTDNPAALLRQAAEILRHSAGRATHDQGPRWILGTTANRSEVVLDHPDEPTVLIETYAERLEAVNAYLIRVHPGVGLALADWLEHTAEFLTGVQETHGQVTELAVHNSRHALAAARQILGPSTDEPRRRTPIQGSGYTPAELLGGVTE